MLRVHTDVTIQKFSYDVLSLGCLEELPVSDFNISFTEINWFYNFGEIVPLRTILNTWATNSSTISYDVNKQLSPCKHSSSKQSFQKGVNLDVQCYVLLKREKIELKRA